MSIDEFGIFIFVSRISIKNPVSDGILKFWLVCAYCIWHWFSLLGKENQQEEQ